MGHFHFSAQSLNRSSSLNEIHTKLFDFPETYMYVMYILFYFTLSTNHRLCFFTVNI